tara:strand:- start:1800 stop:2999 length:1200 start_codon:yes stop_codon:yes gene_type:complete
MRFNYLILIVVCLLSCSEPSIIGLEVQPDSEKITISSNSSNLIDFNNESEESLINNASLNLLGELEDSYFLKNKASFITQILLPETNLTLEENLTVDSVILSYNYSNYYGNLDGISSIEVRKIEQDVYSDSIYYSNDFSYNDFAQLLNIAEDYYISFDSLNPLVRIKINNDIGQQILALGNTILSNNNDFLDDFKGLFVSAQAQNTILYLNPLATNSNFSIYYHNDLDSANTLSFQLDGNAARTNVFEKVISNDILNNKENIYIESMSGYKCNISFTDLDTLQKILAGKVVNQAIMSFELDNNLMINDIIPHSQLHLARLDSDGNIIDLTDYVIEGSSFFGGRLENNIYNFNITRYFHELLFNGTHTNQLYLLDKSANSNANRSIIKKEVELNIIYSDI